MMLNTSRVDVWAADLDDKPGALAAKLEALAKAGADLEFAIARRKHEQPGKGLVFVTPIVGATQESAAEAAGFHRVTRVHSVRVEGADEPGVAYHVTQVVAKAGINMRGLSAGRARDRCIFYLAFDNGDDADRAAKLIATL